MGRVPRVSRLLALAPRLQRLLQQDRIVDYATLARLLQAWRGPAA
jgi:hypothetical protein